MPEGHRPGPGRDGVDARRRRRQPADRRAGDRRDHLPVHARGDGDRGAVRDLRRLALRRRPARQEWHRRRDRHRRAGQGRARDIRPAPRSGRKQRPRAARGPVRCRSGWASTSSSRGRRREADGSWSCLRCSRSPAVPSPRPTSPTRRARAAPRAGRPPRRATRGVRPRRAVPADRRRSALRRADGRAARAVEPGRSRQGGAEGRRHRRPLRVPPRLPGERAQPRLQLREVGPAPARGPRAGRLLPRRIRRRRIPGSWRSSTGSSTPTTTGTTCTRATGR